MQQGWTVIEDPSTLSLWSFTSQGHAAHPAAIHRKIITEGDDIFIKMDVLCEASKPACDQLAVEFNALNEQVRKDLQARRR